MPTEQEKRLQRCCFTGQRPEKLTETPEAVQQWLKEQSCHRRHLLRGAICATDHAQG